MIRDILNIINFFFQIFVDHLSFSGYIRLLYSSDEEYEFLGRLICVRVMACIDTPTCNRPRPIPRLNQWREIYKRYYYIDAELPNSSH
jgi:hypothetical protein